MKIYERKKRVIILKIIKIKKYTKWHFVFKWQKNDIDAFCRGKAKNI